jgi:hypothetical protein
MFCSVCDAILVPDYGAAIPPLIPLVCPVNMFHGAR